MNAPLKWPHKLDCRNVPGIFVLELIFLSGCVSTPVDESVFESRRSQQTIAGEALDFEFNSEMPLGRVEGSGADPEAVGLDHFGLAASMKPAVTMIEAKTTHEGLVFSDQTSEILWFGQFGPRGMVQNNFSRTFRAEWYSPDGKIYHRAKFKSGFFNEALARTPLKLEQPVQDDLLGRWRVKVWKKDTLIDDRYFEIQHSTPG